MTIDLDTLISQARERQAAREAEAERSAEEQWKRQVQEWREQFRQSARDAFGADLMQLLAPKLKVGRERFHEIRAVVDYRGMLFELTCGDFWILRRVDDDDAPASEVGPVAVLRDYHYRLPLEVRQDMLLLALADLADAPPIVPFGEVAE